MIQKSYIFNVDSYLTPIREGESFYVVKQLDEVNEAKIRKIGFTLLDEGTSVLPSICGPKSRFNVNGSYIIRRDLPKEIRYREGCCKDWGGNWHYFDVPYKRFHRDPIPAPEIELTIREKNGRKYIVSPLLTNNDDSKAIIKHTINLFLELFHDCDLFKQSLDPIFSNIPITRVNWLIISSGECPWQRVSDIIKLANRRAKEQAKRATYNLITQYNPERICIGLAGFHGYIAYIFPQKGVALLEHMLNGNATYVFNTDEWEIFSQLSKSEIINHHLMTERIIHNPEWGNKITQLLI